MAELLVWLPRYLRILLWLKQFDPSQRTKIDNPKRTNLSHHGWMLPNWLTQETGWFKLILRTTGRPPVFVTTYSLDLNAVLSHLLKSQNRPNGDIGRQAISRRRTADLSRKQHTIASWLLFNKWLSLELDVYSVTRYVSLLSCPGASMKIFLHSEREVAVC